ncbi:hypothetical protein PR048_021032 [Dryococelus australis]|uniref:Transposase n=1 Tax=Dryococelus australis TaxID=614101 RepID=A0ABQ9GX34_9NEOP|nr:hypothetical protein PR048_021032 [Dryococelus australis]
MVQATKKHRCTHFSRHLKQKAQFFNHEITNKTDYRTSDVEINCLADESEVSEFIQKLNVKITELGVTPEQLYNTNETGLNWRQLPKNMFVTQEEKHVSGRKLKKEWITDGIYISQSRAWVTNEVFHDRYTNNFVPQVKQHLNEKKLLLKAHILLDNAP